MYFQKRTVCKLSYKPLDERCIINQEIGIWAIHQQEEINE